MNKARINICPFRIRFYFGSDFMVFSSCILESSFTFHFPLQHKMIAFFPSALIVSLKLIADERFTIFAVYFSLNLQLRILSNTASCLETNHFDIHMRKKKLIQACPFTLRSTPYFSFLRLFCH